MTDESNKVTITVDLKSLTANPEQVHRLKAYLENEVLTWIKADVEQKESFSVVCNEWGGGGGR